MSVVLPLPYIRQFRSKCFAGDLLHFRASGLKAGDLLEPVSPPAPAAPSGVANPKCHSMFKSPERKEFPSCLSGTFADNRPKLFDAEKRQMVSQEQIISLRT
jgi:hypothetical protein